MKQIGFCAGHRLMNHGGKCENLHGHNYIAQIFVTGQQTDSIGRVVDFSVIKNLFKTWIDKQWDHAMLLWEEDTVSIDALRTIQPNRIHVMPYNPTAENMARYLLESIAPELLEQIPQYNVHVSKVAIWETDTSCAEVSASKSAEMGGAVVGSWEQPVE